MNFSREGIILLQEYVKFSRELKNQEPIHILGEANRYVEHIKISRKAFSKFQKNTYNFPRGNNTIRTDWIFQDNFLHGNLVKTRFSGRSYPKNRYFVKLPRRMLSCTSLRRLDGSGHQLRVQGINLCIIYNCFLVFIC